MEKIKLGIIGLGLIGSSILKGLASKADYEIFCATNSSVEKAKKYSDNVSSELAIVKDCDIVFVCSSAIKTLDYLLKLNDILDKNTIVADVCSIKKIFREFNFDFILTHPMAGTEFCGFDAGSADLFYGAKWLIEKENSILAKVIKDLGAIAKIIDMKKHNSLCAQISHFPTIFSTLLFMSATDSAKEIASSGFRDTTRLAQTSSDLALIMLNENLDEIEKMFEKVKDNFNYLKNLSDDEKITLFEQIRAKRKEMYDDSGKNIFKI